MDKTTILFVDDEASIVNVLAILFKSLPQYNILTSTSAKTALNYFDEQDIHIVVSDQRMPEMTGTQFLSQVQKKSPNTVRMLLTGYADLDAIVDSINEGEVYRYITKPWQNNMLKETMAQAAQVAKLLFPNLGVNVATKQDHKVGKTAESVNDRRIKKNSVTNTKDSGILVLNPEQADFSAVIKNIFKENLIYSTTDVQQATKVLSSSVRQKKEIPVAVINITDNRDDIVSIVNLINKSNPTVLTIVVTDNADADTAIALINQGQVYRYLPRPVNAGRLKMSISSALNYSNKMKNTQADLKQNEVKTTVDVGAVINNQAGENKSGASHSLFAKIRQLIFGAP